MLHIQGEGSDTPTVDYEAKTATVSCDQCNTERTGFPVGLLVKFLGDSFLMTTTGFCGCKSSTVYSLMGLAQQTQEG